MIMASGESNVSNASHYGKKVLVYSGTTLGLYLLKFLMVPVVARNLGLEAYGIWSQISVAVDFLVPFCLLALPDAFVRFTADKKDRIEVASNYYTILFTIIAVGLLISSLFFSLSTFIARGFIRADRPVVSLVQLSALLLFFSCLSQYATNYFRTFQREVMFSFLQLGQAAGAIFFALLCIHWGYGLFQIILVLSLVQLSVFVIAQFFIQREVGWRLPSLKLLQPFLYYSLPLFPFAVLDWLINVSDRYVIGYFLPITEVAKYSACYTLSMIIVLYYAPFYVLLSPKLVELWENKDEATLKKVLEYSNKFPLILSIPTVFGYAIMYQEILRMITGGNVEVSPWIIPSICLGYVFYYIGWYHVQVFILVKRTKYTTIGYIIAAFINLAGNIALVPLIGISGAAVSTMVTFLAQMIYYIVRSRRFYHIRLKWDFLWKIVASSCIMLLSLWLMKPLLSALGDLVFVLLSIGVGAGTYFICILVMGVFEKEEVKLLKSLIVAG